MLPQNKYLHLKKCCFVTLPFEIPLSYAVFVLLNCGFSSIKSHWMNMVISCLSLYLCSSSNLHQRKQLNHIKVSHHSLLGINKEAESLADINIETNCYL